MQDNFNRIREHISNSLFYDVFENEQKWKIENTKTISLLLDDDFNAIFKHSSTKYDAVLKPWVYILTPKKDLLQHCSIIMMCHWTKDGAKCKLNYGF
jgi:hypothetical protein